jgi:hypothetical protein
LSGAGLLRSQEISKERDAAGILGLLLLLDSDLTAKTSKVIKSTGRVLKEREEDWAPIKRKVNWD